VKFSKLLSATAISFAGLALSAGTAFACAPGGHQGDPGQGNQCSKYQQDGHNGQDSWKNGQGNDGNCGSQCQNQGSSLLNWNQKGHNGNGNSWGNQQCQPIWSGGGQGGNGDGNGNGCKTQTVTFDFPADGTTLTEVSGPVLTVGESLSYDSQTYTVASVSGDQFTVKQGGTEVTNTGDTITDGTATTICDGQGNQGGGNGNHGQGNHQHG
jgi:hypothetical protein